MAEPTKSEITKKESDVKAPNLVERAKEEVEAIVHREPEEKKDINEATPVEDVKAPNIIQRAKEEVEALVESILPKTSDESPSSAKKEGGLFASISGWFEKACSPRSKGSQ